MRPLIFFFLLCAFTVNAQTEFSLYRLNGNLPQANMLNPAFAPNSKVTIGLPVISSIYLSADNDGISFRDLFKTSETDSLRLDTLSLFSKLKDSNSIRLNESLQLFYLGVRGKKGFLAISAHQVSEFRISYPGDLLGWAIRGPGSVHYANKPLDFNNFYGKSLVYGKVSLSYARDITDRLRIGARYNYLIGIAAAETTEINGRLTIGIDSVNISTGNMRVETGGIEFFDQNDLTIDDYKNYAMKGRNKGMSIDLGATYHLTDRLMLSASLTDLGFINWKDYTKAYEVAPINYTFKGFDVLDYLNKNDDDQFIQGEIDSLENLYKGTERSGNQFRTGLIGKFYAGINYRVLKVNNFSALLYMDMFNKKINPALSIGYNLQLGRFLNTTIGCTFQNGKINNFGAGMALKLGNLQFYGTSDRANSFLYPARASRADARLGMNLVFGKIKKKDPIKTEPTIKEKREQPETLPVVEEQPAPLEVPQDTTVAAPVMEEPAPIADTTAAVTVDTLELASPILPLPDSTVMDSTSIEIPTDTVSVVEEKPEPVVEKEIIVKQGTHKDELTSSHYVIVGAFKSEGNAKKYSDMLRTEGFDNNFGFVSDRDVYHVFVFKSDSLDEARRVRDQYRQMSAYQFSSSWVLTVEQ